MIIEDAILTIIPIGFIIITVLAYSDNGTRVVVRMAAAYASLLLLQGLVFFRLELYLSAFLTVVNAIVWISLGLKQ